MGIVGVSGVRVQSPIGVSDKEKDIYRSCVVDIKVSLPLTAAGQSDAVADTLDYGLLSRTAQKVMAQPHHLLERAARLIAEGIRAEAPQADKIWIRIAKERPLLPGEVGQAYVEWQYPEDY